jgi:hypothetical protein
MLKLSSVFLLALLMDDSLPILESAVGIPPRLLYQNPEGGRVVCDLQGDWELKLMGAVPDDLLKLGTGFTCLCTESVSTEWGWLALRTGLDAKAEQDRRGEKCDGQGWVRAQNCTVELNGDARPIKIPESLGEVTLPYWNGFLADQTLRFRKLACRLEEIASFSPHDSDSAKEVDFKVERASQVEILSSKNGRGEPVTASVFSHLNRASWTAQIPQQAEVLIIQRSFDAFHGLQRARVFLDEELAGWWHGPLQDRVCRWAADSFHTRLKPDHKGRSVRITLDPPAGVPLFSLSQIRVFALSQ